MIGKTLAHYKVVGRLGKGGMGEVYAAEDTKLRRRIALKVLPQEMAGDTTRRARFEREARAVAALSHPNIVTLHSVEETDGTHFITMELVEGKTLAEMLPRNGFALNRLLELAFPLADAVSCAHRAGITHRDLKPDNVMIDRDGRLRVLDFGLAKLQDAPGLGEKTQAATATVVTEEGKILGTVAYMSPEQAEGKAVDARSDVFSLGTILYEMATGERPFQGETSMSTIGSILKDQPTPVTELNRSLPRHLGRIIRRCLAKDPDRRYQTALELRNEFEELKVEVDSGIHAVESGGVPARPRTSRLLILFGALVVVGIAAIITIQVWKPSGSRAIPFPSRPITNTVDYDQEPCWSPDGKSVAFSRMRSGSFDVYVKPIDGGEAFMRAGGIGDQVAPRWSPDGNQLAFVSSQEPGSSIFLVPAYGGRPKKLIDTDIGALEGLTRAIGKRPWSADGRTLLVSRSTGTGQLAVYRVDRTSGDAEQLTFPPARSSDAEATYSFDGKQIVFARRTQARDLLMMMPAAGGEPEMLLGDEFENRHVAWRPDNRHVVFDSDRAGDSKDLFEIDVVTRTVRQLTFLPKDIIAPSVSLDDRIAYAAFWHDTLLFTVDVHTGERKQLTSHVGNNYGARFSPDGRSIAYYSTRTGNNEIWLHHLDGRPETRFTDHPGRDLYPEWSPDGERLIFITDRDGGTFKLVIANADGGGGARPLVDQPISLMAWGNSPDPLVVRWSPNGEYVGYMVAEEEGAALWTVAPDGEGARRRLGGITGFDWYRNSRHVVVTRRRGSETELIAVDLETDREQMLLVDALMEFDVAPDGNAVAFCFGRGHLAMGLAVLKLESPSDPDGLPRAVGEPEYVARSQGTWHVHAGSWSPDSKSLVYTQDKDYADIHELLER